VIGIWGRDLLAIKTYGRLVLLYITGYQVKIRLTIAGTGTVLEYRYRSWTHLSQSLSTGTWHYRYIGMGKYQVPLATVCRNSPSCIPSLPAPTSRM